MNKSGIQTPRRALHDRIEVNDQVARAGEFLSWLTETHGRYKAAMLWRFCDAN